MDIYEYSRILHLLCSIQVNLENNAIFVFQKYILHNINYKVKINETIFFYNKIQISKTFV